MALSDGPTERRDLPRLLFVGEVAEPGQGEQLGGRKDGANPLGVGRAHGG